MKKFLLTIAIVAISAGSVFAQENSAEKLRWKGIMNNGFWSNWEIGLAGGINATAWNELGGVDNQKSIGDLGWQIEGNLTKWFNPIVGARLQVVGGQLNVSDDNGAKSKWIYPHVDGIVNLSNWIGGYREDRVYYAKLFAGAGVNFVNVNDEAGSGFAGVAGLINTFRVCKQLDINLELKGILSAGRDMPRGLDVIAAKYGQIYSATLGVAYRFNKRNWDKAYNQEEIDGYLASIAAAPKDQVFTLVGHADDETGSPEYNQKLSEKRAKAVYDYLVEQGVNKDQLTWKGVGSSQNIFPINSTNRVVIVK